MLGSVRERAEAEASIPVGFVATVTRGVEGEELTEMAELREEYLEISRRLPNCYLIDASQPLPEVIASVKEKIFAGDFSSYGNKTVQEFWNMLKSMICLVRRWPLVTSTVTRRRI